MLSLLATEVLAETRDSVAAGNKLFGAAILRKADLGLVVVGTNEEVKNPLWHGEVSCLNRFWALSPGSRPEPGACLFLSSHEPCSLCLSAITWSGFDNFYYLFGYHDTRDAFGIPHDLAILAEVFGVADGAYASSNAYWTSYALSDLIARGSEPERRRWRDQVAALQRAYSGLSDTYQRTKGARGIPLD